MVNKKLLLLGSSGLIGSAIFRKLTDLKSFEILTPSSYELDLRDSFAVDRYFQTHKPTHVIHAAGKSGGVYANVNNPSTFSVENTLMTVNVLQSAFKAETKRLLQFIPSCIYPLSAELPYKEEAIGSGHIEESSKYFAYAKLNALMMAQAFNQQHKTEFISIIPSNVYGLAIKSASENSHVIPSLVHRMLVAVKTNQKDIQIWGDGKNKRDFLYSDDLAEATLMILNHASPKPVINVASGEVVSISSLAELIRETVDYKGTLNYKNNGLAGAAHKYLDSSTANALGWKARTSLKDGIRSLLV
ncbi:GDP-L-fucose synthase [Bdellovibrio sp. ZAP7]|uniref:NAD-dependent epimerase/dehydratase family protein n=1 Tax=Bdellovibrio sp. ZAP7 TaxID=2231053 RepID=UPI001159DCF3|nr:NAD-dependent epimerase/dehydratase family protein [Bdellovibrio sp. ZAP7]QDK47108.1 GDP-L-fucose synthase [Bdellovibrio sp. ZAP7]